jgi:hypothetical protein
VIDHGLAAGPVRARVARTAQHVRRLVTGPQWREQLTQFLPFSPLDHVVGIQPEREIADGMRQRLIARRGDAGELRGIPSIPLELAPPPRKGLMVSRSFGRRLTEFEPLREAPSAANAAAPGT